MANKDSTNSSKYERLGNFFGSPLPKLDPEFLPKRADVVRFWIYLVDTTSADQLNKQTNKQTSRTSRILSPDKKKEVKKEVISAVVSIWEAKGLKICCDKNIRGKYDRLISEADSLGNFPNCQKNNRSWIEEQWKKKKYDTIFDIGEASSTPSSAPTTPLKRKSEEMVRNITFDT